MYLTVLATAKVVFTNSLLSDTCMAEETGFEPVIMGSEPIALPLGYSSKKRQMSQNSEIGCASSPCFLQISLTSSLVKILKTFIEPEINHLTFALGLV